LVLATKGYLTPYLRSRGPSTSTPQRRRSQVERPGAVWPSTSQRQVGPVRRASTSPASVAPRGEQSDAKLQLHGEAVRRAPRLRRQTTRPPRLAPAPTRRRPARPSSSRAARTRPPRGGQRSLAASRRRRAMSFLGRSRPLAREEDSSSTELLCRRAGGAERDGCTGADINRREGQHGRRHLPPSPGYVSATSRAERRDEGVVSPQYLPISRLCLGFISCRASR